MKEVDPHSSTLAPHADALQIVRNDHEAIRALLASFSSFNAAPTRAADRHALVARLGALLTAHGDIETGILYPALSGAVDAAMLGRAMVDHREIDAAVQKLAALEPDSDTFSEQFVALAGAVHAHLFEEERSLLPHAAALDLAALGAHMLARRAELLTGQGQD